MPNRQRIPKRMRRRPQKRAMHARDKSRHVSIGVNHCIPGPCQCQHQKKNALPNIRCVFQNSFAQLEEQARIDGDKTLATWLKRILRKELQSRGIEPKG